MEKVTMTKGLPICIQITIAEDEGDIPRPEPQPPTKKKRKASAAKQAQDDATALNDRALKYKHDVQTHAFDPEMDAYGDVKPRIKRRV